MPIIQLHLPTEQHAIICRLHADLLLRGDGRGAAATEGGGGSSAGPAGDATSTARVCGVIS